ncbi:pyruvate, phosphate dikinase [Bradyrhizobium sp.]|uniref:pyruvate, phosphate dikinase n=1 Tax=Bradyrhizobium sp. TaxID=376 RepID=UPI001DCA81F7|nr:pyruvate, phosphate dikinase [Bradyrhizobium sp.]MBI5319377.1 pyruvate, phosphate dikinase [Bradyrhizobium sp.]
MSGQIPVYDLDHIHDCSASELRLRLGGKGAGLVEMRQKLGLPVPHAFVLSTALCRQYLTSGWPDGLDEVIDRKLAALESATWQGFGDSERPLLVSVRSGAPVSMPGMMDTILNLGANAVTIAGLAARTGDERFALDTWARFCRMYAGTVLGVGREKLGENLPREASAAVLRADIDRVRDICAREGTPIPDNARTQLRGAIEAVFRSSRSERARVYCEREGLGEEMPTAVLVQAMAFGNLGVSSGTGVAFSRNPSTGGNETYGDFLANAQGEDVVAGIRASRPLAAMRETLPEVHDELGEVLRRIERHYRDLCDVEFTVQEGRLQILQVRAGKRSAIAAARIAIDLANEGLISREEAVRRVSAEQLRQLKSMARVRDGATAIASGVAASPGVVSGVICLDPDRVADLAAGGSNVILVRPTTSPEDVHGMAQAAGIVTATGGMVSHAALVARGWGIAAVCGVEALQLAPALSIAGKRLEVGARLTIDGTAGKIYLGECVEAGHGEPPELETLRRWAAEAGLPLGGEEDIGAAPGTDAAEDSGTCDIGGFAVVRALALLGFATAERVAIALATSPDAVDGVLKSLPQTYISKAPRGLHVTPEGRAWLQGQLKAERDSIDRRAAERLYGNFMALDARFKQLVADWQIKLIGGRQVPNDHTDAAYDAAIRARLADFHQATLALLPDILTLVPRLRPFATRLAHAARAVAAGDCTMIASPLKDSYHTAWFELHEELIHLAGRDRAIEEARSGG